MRLRTFPSVERDQAERHCGNVPPRRVCEFNALRARRMNFVVILST